MLNAAGAVSGVAHFGFRLVDPNDIDQAIMEVERAGGRLLRRGEFAPGVPYAYVADPGGYEIEIWFECPGSEPRHRRERTRRAQVVFPYGWSDENGMAMTSRRALAFVRKHGVVLESAQGPVPSLAEAIAGEPIRRTWWSHQKSQEIFAVTRAVRNSEDVLVCRLIKGKITFVHRRLWPALVRAAGRLPARHLSQVREVHTSAGHHVTKEVPFPDWVPPSVRAVARTLSEEAALAAFDWI